MSSSQFRFYWDSSLIMTTSVCGANRRKPAVHPAQKLYVREHHDLHVSKVCVFWVGEVEEEDSELHEEL